MVTVFVEPDLMPGFLDLGAVHATAIANMSSVLLNSDLWDSLTTKSLSGSTYLASEAKKTGMTLFVDFAKAFDAVRVNL